MIAALLFSALATVPGALAALEVQPASLAAKLPPVPSAKSVVHLGTQRSTNLGVPSRDLGYSGRIGDNIITTYGDSRNCTDGVCLWPSASNGVALQTRDPLVVTDFKTYMADDIPRQFVQSYPDEPNGNGQWALGVTNVVPTSKETGAIFWLLNNRTDGTHPIFLGSGIATIDLTRNGTPMATRVKYPYATGRRSEYWWDYNTEPSYGGQSSLLAPDGYIYAFGGLRDTQNAYVCRVLPQNVADIDKYEYWNGESYTSQRLINPGDKESVIFTRGQGSIIFSEFHQAYLNFELFFGKLYARAAFRPEGPYTNYSDPLYYGGQNPTHGLWAYTAAAAPWWDDSGNSLALTYTDVNAETVAVCNITWAGTSKKPPTPSGYLSVLPTTASPIGPNSYTSSYKNYLSTTSQATTSLSLSSQLPGNHHPHGPGNGGNYNKNNGNGYPSSVSGNSLAYQSYTPTPSSGPSTGYANAGTGSASSEVPKPASAYGSSAERTTFITKHLTSTIKSTIIVSVTTSSVDAAPSSVSATPSIIYATPSSSINATPSSSPTVGASYGSGNGSSKPHYGGKSPAGSDEDQDDDDCDGDTESTQPHWRFGQSHRGHSWRSHSHGVRG